MVPMEVSPVCALRNRVQGSNSRTVVPCKMLLIVVHVLSVFFTFSCLGKIVEGPNALAISH